MVQKSFNKVFCIGMNKTGTRSLHKAFKLLGLRSLHHAPDGYSSVNQHVADAAAIRRQIEDAQREGRRLLEGIEEYDTYSDIGPILRFYPLLDEQYPGSKFIYTQRDMDSWLESRRRHVERNRAAKERGAYSGTFLEIEPERWENDKIRHFEAVTSYFAGREDDLLIFNICGGEGFEKLCPFLGLPEPAEPFPWVNRSRPPKATAVPAS